MYIFLSGKGVEIENIEDSKFNVREIAAKVLDAGGQYLACGACLKFRDSAGKEICPLSTLKDKYKLVMDSDKLVTI